MKTIPALFHDGTVRDVPDSGQSYSYAEPREVNPGFDYPCNSFGMKDHVIEKRVLLRYTVGLVGGVHSSYYAPSDIEVDPLWHLRVNTELLFAVLPEWARP